MQFIKTNWISLLSGLLALAGIAGAVYGMMQDDVLEAMDKHKRVASEIASLTRAPQNTATIESERDRGQRFQEAYDAALAVAERINQRRPLRDGVFPNPAQDELRYRFKDDYEDAILALPRELHAGGLPSEQEIRDEEDSMRIDAMQEPQPGEGRPAGQRDPTIDSGEVRLRAGARKARGIRCYVDTDPARSSFHVSPIVESIDAPSPAEMWYAQVGLWIQQDVVSAIGKVNGAAARQLDADQQNVAGMPVKRIEKIDILGYLTDQGKTVAFASIGRGSSSTAGGVISVSFTDRKSDDQFDVIRFRLTAIVDLRDLPQLIDRVTRENFYQLVGASYAIVEVDKNGYDDNKYLYGPDPVCRVELEFEGYMARKVYKEMMPAQVLVDLGIGTGNG